MNNELRSLDRLLRDNFSGVVYLRGCEEVLNKSSGDLDILVQGNDWRKFIAAIYSSPDIFILNSFTLKHFAKLDLVLKVDEALYGLQVDLFDGLYIYDKLAYLSFNDVSKAADTSLINLEITLLKNYLHNNDPKIFENDMQPVFSITRDIRTMGVSNTQFLIYRHKINYFKAALYYKLRRMLMCKNKYDKIVFVGPDGSGKSTLIERLATILARASNSSCVNIHSFKCNDRNHENVITSGAPNHKRSNFFYSSFKAIYVIFRVYYLWLCVLRPKYASKYKVFDRFVYDLWMQPERYLINHRVTFSLWGYIMRFRSKFLLKASPGVIVKRKAELTEEQITAFYAKAESLPDYCDFHEVDAEKRICDILVTIVSCMEKDFFAAINNSPQ